MKKNKYFSIVLSLWLTLGVGAMDISGRAVAQGGYGSPVDFPITLSGNVGEIRSNHFHTGIDIKALHGVGSPVRAIADGYVSRIGVSATGYGLVLYVTHAALGEVSVYGHLDSFAPRIADWVRQQQYARKSFAVDLYPTKEQFPVRLAEQIGSLGNSGSSGGPHLHLEIRDSRARPINIITSGIYQVPDHVVPTVSGIVVYEIDTVCGVPQHRVVQNIPLRTLANGTVVPADIEVCTIKLSRNGYLAYKVIDYKDGRTNTMGIYSLEQRVDGSPNFSFRIDKLNFVTQRQVNTFTDYVMTRQSSKCDVIRAYVSPGNTMQIYSGVRSRGVIDPLSLRAGSVITTVITDEAGNSSMISLPIERVALDTAAACANVDLEARPGLYPVYWDRDFSFNKNNVSLRVAAGSLYESTLLMLRTNEDNTIDIDSFTDIPVQRGMALSFSDLSKIRELTSDLSKALIVRLSSGRMVNAGGKISNGVLQTTVTSLGRYSVAVDTVAPVVTAVARNAKSGNKLQFKISDNLSGIASYNLTVDGRWELIEYDPRRAMLTHTYRGSEYPAKHNVELTVTDRRGNRQTFKQTMQW